MTNSNDSVTIEWVRNELKAREWRNADLARHGDIPESTISRVLNAERSPGLAFWRGVARAFSLSEETVLARVGLLSLKAEHDDLYLDTLETLWERIPDWKRRDLIVHVRAFVEDFERREAERAAKRKLGEPVEGYDVY